MNKTKSPLRRKRPLDLQKKTIKQISADNKASLHAIDCRKVSIHSAGDGAGEGDLGGVFAPTDEQVAKINQFTMKSVTSDEVVAFTANAMNDMYDRDDEKFTKQTVNEFASLPQPFSPVGKSYMVDHEYKIANAKGRIFDVGTKTIGGIHFLRPEIYMPKTAQYADFIESMEFGINWAVSVGVVVDKSACSICSAPVYSSRMFGWSWCDNGHEKGYYYVPGQEEDDGWGFFEPVDPSTKGAVKAKVDLKDPVDFYELSQVFLGAQYFAELANKTPSIKSALKTAAKRSIPIVGLSFKEAKGIEMKHKPKEVRDAERSKQGVTEEEDGTIKWIDEAGIGWSWNPDAEEGKVLCLGATEKGASDGEDDEDDPDAEDDDDEGSDSESNDDESDDDEDGADKSVTNPDNNDGQHASDAVVAAQAKVADAKAKLSEAQKLVKATDDQEDINELADAIDGVSDALDVLADDLLEALGMTEEEEDGSVAAAPAAPATTKAPNASAVLKAAVTAKLPKKIIDALAESDDETALGIAFSEASKMIKSGDRKIKDLEPKAKLGEQYVAELNASALHWFTVSRRDPKNPQKGVNVEHAQKLIKLAGGDPTTLKSLIDDWKGEAEAKFPSSRRQSAFPAEVEERSEKLPDVIIDEAQIKKLHG